ncbi:extracellular solute-binding protein [Candidatus Kuenenbacteria bacterium]|nr:extracellular solute-binding protein [Candidatus Kuenenbacteria bacterium]
MLKSTVSKIIILGLLGIFLTTTGFGCKFLDRKTQEAMKPVEINYWRVLDNKTDSQDDFVDIIKNYKAIHPNITINYKELRYEEYEEELLNGWAEDRGPDIFSIHNTWVGKYKNKILPMPKELLIPQTIITGTFKKEPKIIMQPKATPSLKILKDKFVDVVYKDAIREEQVYGLPLSIDSLALYYNKNILNNARIPLPPATWTEFIEMIPKTTIVDKEENIIQAGAALGTAKNIANASDILSLLMMQNGTQMIDEGNRATFNRASQAQEAVAPGEQALIFYTDFANPTKETYTWSDQMPEAFDSFIQGKLAFYFGYLGDLYLIQNQAPKLNFSIAPMLQIEGNPEINYANYWIETVSKKTKYSNEAWDFVLFATQEEQAKLYLEKNKKPTALRNLIKKQEEDYDLSIFAKQVLTAQSWYRGNGGDFAKKIFNELIDETLKGGVELKQLLNLYAEKINQTF